MFGRQEIHEGMTVRARDGEKLGRVYAIEDNDFIIEKGLFFPKEYVVLYEDVMDVKEEDIILRAGREALQAERGDVQQSAVADASDVQEVGTARVQSQDRALNVPVVEEQLDVSKRDREVGAVQVRKEVVEETRTVDVPVRREVVHVERVPVTPGQALPPDADAPAAAELRVPLHEEEVIVTKKPVVTEEVRVRMDVVEDRKHVEEEVRREEVSVTGDDGAANRVSEPRPKP